MYKEITNCRICRSSSLLSVLSLGEQTLTGVFPKSKNDKITTGPLDLVWCGRCTLLQLKQSYDPGEMYGNNYGYRSGLNSSMVSHLKNKVKFLENFSQVKQGDLILDIGSNDATTLKAYSSLVRKIGIDPTGDKFKDHYSEDMQLISDFFSAQTFKKNFGSKKVKIITSIAMFYDLEDPLSFVRDISDILDDEGIWHFEQSYMPSMLRTNSYDTICHEHIEFYSFRVVKNLLEDSGLKVIDVVLNSINGGSFALTAAKKSSSYRVNTPIINWMLRQEDDLNLETPAPYREFERRVFRHRRNLQELIQALVDDGKKIIGYGASTKGNVLLQFCDFSTDQISCVAEVNKEKYGSFTPGTNIPIVSEEEAKSYNPDYLLVLPWHFKAGILERERKFWEKGGKFIFPLPEIEIV